MLEYFRSRKDSFVLKAFLGVLAMSFGIWGVGDFMGASPLAPGIILKAGDAELKTELARRRFETELNRFRTMMGDRAIPDDVMRRTVMGTMLQDLTRSTVLDAAAMGVGINISRDQVRETIMKDETFQQDGTFSQIQFEQVLSTNRLTEAGYVELAQTDLRNAMLMQPVRLNAGAPEFLVKDLFAYRNETRVADTVLIPAAGIPLQKVPNDDELKAVYEKNIAAFTAPEYRTLTVLILSGADLVKPESIDEAEVKTYYDENGASYRAPESRQLVQLVFDSKEKAEVARAYAAPGDSLETLAAKAKAGAVIDMGELTATSQLGKTLAAAFTTPANEISQPIESPLGWHLVQVKSIKPEAVRAFDEVKDQIRKSIAADKGADAVYDASTQLEDALASGTPIAEVAKAVGARIVKIESTDQDGMTSRGLPNPGLIDPVNLIPTAFTTAAGKDSKLMDLPTRDGYYVVHVDAVTPPTPKPLLDVRPQVAAMWEGSERMAQAQAIADKLAGGIGPSTQLSTVAAGVKDATYAPLGPLTRFGEGLDRQHVIDSARVSPQALDKLFTAKIGDVFVAPVATGVVVGRLTSIQSPTAAGDLARVQEQLGLELRNEIAGNLMDQLARAFGERYPVEIDQVSVDAMIIR